MPFHSQNRSKLWEKDYFSMQEFFFPIRNSLCFTEIFLCWDYSGFKPFHLSLNAERKL